MWRTAGTLVSLLLATAGLMLGIGLLNTLLPLRATSENFPQSLTGIAMAGYYAGFLAGSWLHPRLILRIGHIRTFSGTAVLACVVTLLHGLFVDPFLWALLRMVSGVCMIGLYMVIESWLSAAAEPRQRGRLFALYMTITLLGLAGAQYLILPYGVEALATFAVAACFFGVAVLPVTFTRLAEPTVPLAAHANLQEAIANAPIAMIGAAATGLANGAFWLLGPVFIRLAGGEDVRVAVFMSAVIVGGALLQLPIGYLSDRLDRRVVLIALAVGAMASAQVILHVVENGQMSLAGAALVFGGFAFSIYAICVAHAIDVAGERKILETIRSLLLLHGLGALAAPILAGILMDQMSHRALFVYISCVYGAYALLAAWFTRRGPVIREDQQAPFVPVTRTSSEALDAIHVPTPGHATVYPANRNSQR